MGKEGFVGGAGRTVLMQVIAVHFRGVTPRSQNSPTLHLNRRASGQNITHRVTVRFAVFLTPAYVPEIVTDVDQYTLRVVIVKVALVLPLATVTVAGTAATDLLLLDNETTAPPLGAGPLRVTVPVELLPPLTVVGLTLKELNSAGSFWTVLG
jgi:hypothetical protein